MKNERKFTGVLPIEKQRAFFSLLSSLFVWTNPIAFYLPDTKRKS